MIALLIFSIITLAANFALEEKSLRTLVNISIVLMNLLILLIGGLYVGLATLDAEQVKDIGLETIEMSNALTAFVIMLITALLATALLFRAVREKLGRFFPKRQASSVKVTLDGAYYPSNPNAESLQGYDAANPIHMIALIFCVYLTGIQLANLALLGGLDGLADDFGISWELLVANFLPQVIIPLLGIGLFLRRSGPEAFERLGLYFRAKEPFLKEYLPNWAESIVAGVAVGWGMILVVFVMSIIWQLLVSPETYQAQNEASEALANSIDTFWLGLGVAVFAAVGEEIAFRGALQPVFGFWATAFLFAFTHIQYVFTPASLIIFAVAISFGLLRKHYNLYSAMIAHFVYDFTLIMLGLLASSMLDEEALHIFSTLLPMHL